MNCFAFIWANMSITSYMSICCWSKVPKIPPSTLPFLAFPNSSDTQAWDDQTWSSVFWRWPFPPHDIWAWALHRWLRGTGTLSLHCQRLVSKVLKLSFWNNPPSCLLPWRCLAPRNNLDSDALDRCREHTDALVEEGTLGELWDDYGIVGDLIVSLSSLGHAFT
jgi:hypothetical protein